MVYFLIFFVAACVRIALWLLEALAGIGDDFHPDSVYHLETARYLIARNFDGWSDYALNNELYAVIAAAVLQIVDSITVLRVANLVIGSTIPVLCFRLFRAVGCSGMTVWAATLFASLLPYQAHLSIHALKDTAFLFSGIALTFYLIRRKIIMALLMAALLIGLRTYLGAMIAGVMLALFFGRSRLFLPVVGVLFFGVLLFLAGEYAEFLLERQTEIIEGREFFSSVQVYRPNPDNYLSLLLFAVTAPIRQIFVPSLLDVRSFMDLAFGVHVLFYQCLFAATAIAIFRRHQALRESAQKKPLGGYLIVVCVTTYALSIAFIDVVTPGIGPVVRYRELSFFLLAIACFVVLDYCRRSAIVHTS